MSRVPFHKRITPSLRSAFDSAGINDPERIVKYSLLNAPRLEAIVRACVATAGLGGATAEIGCASGGTTRLIALMNGGKNHYAVDTFEGLKDADAGDGGLKNGDFENRESKLDGVRSRAADLANVEVIQGYFPDCATESMQAERYALVHLDTDTYTSMRAGFEFFQSRMLSGSMMILDDVIGRGTVGGKRFWKEMQRGNRYWRIVESNDPHVVIRFD